MSKPHTLEDCRADRHDWGLDYCRVSGRGDQPVIEMLVYCHALRVPDMNPTLRERITDVLMLAVIALAILVLWAVTS